MKKSEKWSNDLKSKSLKIISTLLSPIYKLKIIQKRKLDKYV